MENVKQIGTLIALFALVVALTLLNATTVKAQPSSISMQSTGVASSSFIGGYATTSLAYMSAGNATSTYQIDSNGSVSTSKPNVTMASIDASSVFIEFVASTSASILQYQFQFSNNNVDWYSEGSSQTLGSGGNATSSVTTHTFSTNTLGTSTVVVLAPATPAYHERIVFSIPNGSANGGVYAEVVTKKNPSNP